MMLVAISLMLCSALSFGSATLILFYYTFWKSARTYSFTLVLPIFLYDFLFLFDYFIPTFYFFTSSHPYISNSICRLQGFTKVFRTNGTYFSTLIISWILYSHFVRKIPIKIKNPIYHYSPFTFVLPLFIALIPLIFDNYDHIEPLQEIMCYLVVKNLPDGQTDTAGIIQKILFSFIPFIFTVFTEIFFVFRILYYFWKDRQNKSSVNIKCLILYPLFLLLSQIWIVYENFYELLYEGQQVQWLNEFALQVFVLNGFMNSIIYGYISINPCGYISHKDNNKFDKNQIQNDIESEDWSVESLIQQDSIQYQEKSNS